MSNQTLTLPERFNQIDHVATNFLGMTGTGFAAALQTAEAMKQLRELLTPEAMAPVMELMNSPLGFLTDKDPNKPAWKNGQEVVPKPYSVQVVRDCVIEATLRGIPLVGNCMNIISSRTYVTKDGFGFLLKKIAGLTDLKIVPGVPKNVGESGALVEMRATWKVDGREDGLERLIPVRVNAQMGTDAILGKAERKMRCAIYNQITGSSLSDGEASEEDAAAALNKPATLVTTVAAPPKAAAEKAVAKSCAGTLPTTAPAAVAPAVEAATPGEEPPAGPPKATPVEGMTNLCRASGVTEKRLIEFVKEQGNCDPQAQILEDLPEQLLADIKASWENLLPLLKAEQPVLPTEDSDLVVRLRELMRAEEVSEERLVDWCIGKRFLGLSATSIRQLPESRVTWFLNNGLAKNKEAVLAGPSATLPRK